MLLLRAEGLHSVLQMAWSVYRKTVAEVLSPPGELILYCGMSIGFEDVTVREDHTGRAPLDETVMFVDSLVARLPESEKYFAIKAFPSIPNEFLLCFVKEKGRSDTGNEARWVVQHPKMQKSCLRNGGSDGDFKSNSGAMHRGVFAVLTLVLTVPS